MGAAPEGRVPSSPRSSTACLRQRVILWVDRAAARPTWPVHSDCAGRGGARDVVRATAGKRRGLPKEITSPRTAPPVKPAPTRTAAQRATEGPFTDKPPAPRTEAQTRLTCYCATDYDSIGLVLRAYKDSDAEVLAGLIVRGKAIELAKGTHVYVAGREDGVATVLVESGYHSGQKCYLWGKFIEL
jgi:hypothetical protein